MSSAGRRSGAEESSTSTEKAAECLYALLGIKRDADEAEIKKA
jgi:hypothetical protein